MNALFVLVTLKRKVDDIQQGKYSMLNAPQNRFVAVPWKDDCDGSSKTNHLRHQLCTTGPQLLAPWHALNRIHSSNELRIENSGLKDKQSML
ncbi:MAG: hypothetical protein ACJ0BN_02695 [Limisphaerales bacterium]|nr:hypothetical protein [Pedosphaera sp.]MBL6843895.1 hypothetical protein [Verrucomicrobiae bacterium]RZO70005.1 MAG: hypothetical protein EVA71_07585 [Limisphaerales bacterium]HAQ97834.1 hypothetical protein [Verrucomicrobiales bacterium]HAW00626.1 hypothetical protein [Verrucomicrobiales bacterium]|tara:strand:- start:2029 stop:2304 length:276 start_codon:yes stop_codon:yes gene_type:complete